MTDLTPPRECVKYSAPVNPKLWPSEDERELWRWKCYDSLWWYGMIGCGALNYMAANPKDAGTLTETVHRPFVEWKERHLKEWLSWRAAGIKRRKKLADILPRFFRKTLWNRISDLWCHLHDPDLSTALGSVDTDLAKQFLDARKATVSGADPYGWHVWLYGNWYDKRRTWDRFKTVHGARHDMGRQDPSWFLFSIKSGLVGTHPDRTELDDPIDLQKLTEEANWINTVNSGIDGFRPAMRTDGLFILTMTRYHMDDPPGHFFPKEGVREWVGDPIPETMRYKDGTKIKVSPEGEWNVYYLSAFNEKNESICPEIITTEELRNFERSNPILCASQYRNNPIHGEHMPLTIDQIQDCFISKETLHEDYLTHGAYILLCDTAFKDDESMGKGDDSVCILSCYDPAASGDVLYVEGFGSNEYRTETFAEEVAVLLQRLSKEKKRVAWIVTEKPISSDEVDWYNYLRSICAAKRILCPPLHPIKVQGRKAKPVRIRISSAYWADGHVKLLRGAPNVDKLTQQMLEGGYGKHDDWADAFSNAFRPEIYRMVTFSGGDETESPIPISPGDEYITGLGEWRQSRRARRQAAESGIIDTVPDEAFQ